MSELQLGDQILHELRLINQRLKALESAVPVKDMVWLSPADMSKLAGVTPRTLQNYVNQGRLSARSYKRTERGRSFTFKYHRELTLLELGMIGS